MTQPLLRHFKLTCDGCGCKPRRPAFDIAGRVRCARCAKEVGMDTGEFNPIRPYGEWARLASERQAAAICGLTGCDRPLFDPVEAASAPEVIHRCALHEIASYNLAELREWGEENAADMVAYARRQLSIESPMTLVPGDDY